MSLVNVYLVMPQEYGTTILCNAWSAMLQQKLTRNPWHVYVLKQHHTPPKMETVLLVIPPNFGIVKQKHVNPDLKDLYLTAKQNFGNAPKVRIWILKINVLNVLPTQQTTKPTIQHQHGMSTIKSVFNAQRTILSVKKVTLAYVEKTLHLWPKKRNVWLVMHLIFGMKRPKNAKAVLNSLIMIQNKKNVSAALQVLSLIRLIWNAIAHQKHQDLIGQENVSTVLMKAGMSRKKLAKLANLIYSWKNQLLLEKQSVSVQIHRHHSTMVKNVSLVLKINQSGME